MKKRAQKQPATDAAREQARLLETLQTKSKDELITLFVDHLRADHRVPEETIKAALEKQESLLPGGIFLNDTLSALETITKYLKENKGFSFARIADILNRDDRSIWTTYHNATKKLPARLPTEQSRFHVPASIFAERTLSVLETLTTYLKDTLGFSYHEIAVGLHRDDRTIWTVYHRAQKKRGAA